MLDHERVDDGSAGCRGVTGSDVLRLVSVADADAAAVDATIRCRTQDGSISTVSSADIYEFDAAGLLTTITSYAVELA